MNRAKGLLAVAAAALLLGFTVHATAADAAKTVSGKASCGGCSGVVKGCCVMLTDADGIRWILRGDNASLKAAFGARHSGKTMTATLAGKPETKKGNDGREYKEVKVSDIKIGS